MITHNTMNKCPNCGLYTTVRKQMIGFSKKRNGILYFATCEHCGSKLLIHIESERAGNGIKRISGSFTEDEFGRLKAVKMDEKLANKIEESISLKEGEASKCGID